MKNPKMKKKLVALRRDLGHNVYRQGIILRHHLHVIIYRASFAGHHLHGITTFALALFIIYVMCMHTILLLPKII